MELKVIEQLLEKYLEGDTTLQEEAQLGEYFGSEEVAPHLQEYAMMFSYFSTSRAEKYSGELLREDQISDFGNGNRKDSEADYEDQASVFSETPDEEGMLRKIRKEVYSWVAVAASIVIMAGIFLQEEQQVSEFGSYEDPELAMEKTKEALIMVSQLMNSGNDDLGYISEFNITKNKITKK